MNYRVKENSVVARIARVYMKSKTIAIVFGKTIHISGVSKGDFLQNRRWLEHELQHIRQYHQYGFWGFLYRYLKESFKKGYYNNFFEVEARQVADKVIKENPDK